MSTVAEEPRLRDLTEVRVKKDDLLAKIRANKETHKEEYETAEKDWKDLVTEWFKEQGEMAAAGKRFVTSFGLQRPQDHTKDYEAVISMLEMSLDDELELSFQEFNQYVMDNWQWSEMTKSTYGLLKEEKTTKAHLH